MSFFVLGTFLIVSIIVVVYLSSLIQDNKEGIESDNNIDKEKIIEAEIVDPEDDIQIIEELESPTIFLEPIRDTKNRVTKKPFGILIEPSTSPVQPERFRGYHTGIDIEVFPEELGSDIQVKSISSGELIFKQRVNGYGGVLVVLSEIGGEEMTVLYGHMDLGSVGIKTGEKIEAGEVLGLLGDDKSSDTDGERMHLHLAMHRGAELVMAGYTDKKEKLDSWIDPCIYICK